VDWGCHRRGGRRGGGGRGRGRFLFTSGAVFGIGPWAFQGENQPLNPYWDPGGCFPVQTGGKRVSAGSFFKRAPTGQNPGRPHALLGLTFGTKGGVSGGPGPWRRGVRGSARKRAGHPAKGNRFTKWTFRPGGTSWGGGANGGGTTGKNRLGAPPEYWEPKKQMKKKRRGAPRGGWENFRGGRGQGDGWRGQPFFALKRATGEKRAGGPVVVRDGHRGRGPTVGGRCRAGGTGGDELRRATAVCRRFPCTGAGREGVRRTKKKRAGAGFVRKSQANPRGKIQGVKVGGGPGGPGVEQFPGNNQVSVAIRAEKKMGRRGGPGTEGR